MTPAEKFAMCMAEAGFPVEDVHLVDCEQGCPIHWNSSRPEPWTAEETEAIWRAMRLIGLPLDPCLPCYLARAASWSPPFAAPCEHVEVTS